MRQRGRIEDSIFYRETTAANCNRSFRKWSRWPIEMVAKRETNAKGRNKEERGGRPRSVRRCRDVERLCAAFYEFPSAELAFLSDAKREWDKAKPYSPQVLFKFSSPLSTSCAPSLSALLGATDPERKKVARRSAESRDHTLFCRDGAISSECSKLFSGNDVKNSRNKKITRRSL